MTVTTETVTAGPYIGNGTSATFSFGFRVDDASELLVFKYTTSTGASLQLIEGSDFTISGLGVDTGGSITLTAGVLPSGYTLQMRSNYPRTQTTSFQSQGGFFPITHTEAMDRLARQIQQLQYEVGRMATAPADPAEKVDVVAGDVEADSLVLAGVPVAPETLVGTATDEQMKAGTPGVVPDAEQVRKNHVATVNTWSDLETTFEPAFDGQLAYVASRLDLPAPMASKGGGMFYADFSDITTASNGVTVAVTTGGKRIKRKIESGALSSEWAGVHPTQTAAFNLAALKSVVASANEGDEIIIPAADTFYSVDTSGGLSDAVDVNKKLKITINGDLKATFSAVQANPPFIFNVTADDVTFCGSGTLIGDGAIDSTNTGNQNTFTGLIRASGDRFECSGLSFRDYPKTAVALVGSTGSKVHKCKFFGGSSDTSAGLYTGIYLYSGGSHKIYNNEFLPNGSGGSNTQCIFGDASHNLKVYSNDCKESLRNFFYCYTDNSRIFDNTVINVSGSGNAIRINGSDNDVHDNYIKGTEGGVTIYDGSGNHVHHNQIIDTTDIGINIGILYAPAATHDRTVIDYNTIKSSVGTVRFAIRVGGASVDSSDIDVSHNTIDGFPTVDASYGAVSIGFGSGVYRNVSVEHNPMKNVGIGVFLNTVESSCVHRNMIDGSTYPMREIAGAKNEYSANKCRNATNIGILGLSASSYGVGNSYNDSAIVGWTAMTAATNVTPVNIGGVASNAIITLIPRNSFAAQYVGTTGMPRTSISGGNFSIVSPSGNFAGTEEFSYRIDQ